MYTQNKPAYYAFDGTSFDDKTQCLDYEAERRELLKDNLFSDEAIMIVNGDCYRCFDLDKGFMDGEPRWIWFRSTMPFITFLRYIVSKLPDGVKDQLSVVDTVNSTKLERAKFVSNTDHAIPYVRAWHQFSYEADSQTLYVLDSAARVGALLRSLEYLDRDYAERNDLPN